MPVSAPERMRVIQEGNDSRHSIACNHPRRNLAMAPKNLDPKPVTRRSFLKTTGAIAGAAGLAPAMSAPFVSTAFAQTKALSIVQWSHFVPEYDTWFDKFAKDWGEKNKISVTVDHIPVQNIPARAAAEASPDRDMIFSDSTGPVGRISTASSLSTSPIS